MRWVPVVALSLLVLALPAQAAHQADSATITIRLFSTVSSFKVLVDRAPTQKESKGDVFRQKTTLRNAVAQFGRPKGAIVGSDTETYAFVSPTQADVSVQAKLPGGTLRAEGRVHPFSSKPQTIRVTGGTRTFANARGTAEARRASGDRFLHVYRLQLP